MYFEKNKKMTKNYSKLYITTMSHIDIIINMIKEVYYSSNEYTVNTYQFYNMYFENMAELGCSVCRKLGLDNWFVCADINYFALEIKDKYIIVYFEYNSILTDCVIRRCNNEKEFNEMILAIS